MTLPYSPSKAVYNGNGATVDFPFAFQVWKTSQLEVSVTDPQGVVQAASGWTASITATGGTVTYRKDGAPLPTGWKLAVLRNMPFEQNIDLISGTRFDPEVVERRLDEDTAERQQLKEAVDRAIKVPPTSQDPPELLADMIFAARDEAAASAADAAASEAAAAGSAASAATSAAEAASTVEQGRADIAGDKADALAVMAGLRDEAVTTITRTGQMQVNAVQAAGASLVAVGNDAVRQVMAEGDKQTARVQGTGAQARVDVVLEGDAQVLRVSGAGADYVRQTHEEAQKATGEADRAEAAADRATSIADMDIASPTNIGICPMIGEGLKVTMLPSGNPRLDAIAQVIAVSTPELAFAADVALGFAYNLGMSAGTLIPGGRVTGYEVTVDGVDMGTVVADSEGIATLSVTPQGVDLTTGTLAVTAIDSEGNRSKLAYKTFTKHAVAVRAPHILSPLDGDTDVPLLGAFQIQSFDIYGMPSTGAGTQLCVATDAEFGEIVYDSGENRAYATVITLTDRLPDKTVLYARARHKADIYGWSPWGKAVAFTTIAKTVGQPRIIAPIGGAVEQPLDVAVVLSALQTTGIDPTPANTRVIVARDAELTDRVFDSLETGAYATSVATAGLPVNTLLYVTGQHRDTELGWSELAEVSTFTTLNAYTNAAVVTAPVHGATDVARRPVIQLAAHSNVGPADTGNGTQIQIATDAGFTNVVQSCDGGYVASWTPEADLGIYTTYFVRARHRGVTWGWGAWSAVVQFQTLQVTLTIAPITQPVSGGTDVSLRPVFRWDAPVPVNQVYDEDRLKVSTDPGFPESATIYSSVASAERTAQLSQDLLVDTAYYAMPFARGSITGYVSGPVSSFRTVNAYVHAPAIISPANGATGVDRTPILTVTAFSNEGPVDNPVDSEFQIHSTPTFSGGTGTSSYGAGYKTSWRSTMDLSLSTTYYARARHKGALWGWGAWSETVSFTVTAAYINTPALTAPVNNAVDVNVAATLQSTTAFAGQTLAKVQYQVSASNTFASIAWDSGEIAHTASITTGTLAKNTKYYARVRTQGSVNGWTAWSAAVGFTTVAAVVGDVWTFTASNTWVCPVNGTYEFETVGGGGGGWGAAFTYCSFASNRAAVSGAGGGYAKVTIFIDKNVSIPVTVGGGGANKQMAFEWDTSASGGGTSSIGSYCSASGGGGGGGTISVPEYLHDCVNSVYPSGGSGSGGITASGGPGTDYSPWGIAEGGSGHLGYGRGGNSDRNWGTSDYGQVGLCLIKFIG